MVILWDTTGQQQLQLQNEPMLGCSYRSLSFSPNGGTLAVAEGCDYAVTIELWDVQASLDTNQPVLLDTRSFPDEAYGTSVSIQFSPDGQTLIFHGSSWISIWDRETETVIQTIADLYPYPGFALSPDGNLLAYTTHRDSEIHFWDLSSGEEAGILDGHIGYVDALAFNNDGSLLASAGWDGTIRFWGVP